MIIRAAAVAIGVALTAAAGFAPDPPEEPHDVGLTERASVRLAQIDVSVAGAKGAIEGLTAADFEVKLNDKLVPNVFVDDLCSARPAVQAEAAPQAPAETQSPANARAATPHSTTATYLLYFDMAHLTQSGRQGSIDTARELLRKILAGGNRATIVANAAQLKTVVPLTADASTLDAALAKMIDDQSTFDPYAALEQRRLADVVAELGTAPTVRTHETGMDPNMGGLGAALRLAHIYAAEERWRQERDLRRLSMVLGRFSELDPPKVVLYFADTMRQNAGEHYLSFFGGTNIKDTNGKAPADAEAITVDAATGAVPLDRVMNDASALGVRFYTIEGQGITGESSPIEARNSASIGRPGAAGNQPPPVVNSQHLKDAQNTMVSLAAETGGRAFLNGVAPGKMSAQILGDMSCVYLLSFDPRGFPQDKPLAVAVAVKRAKVKTVVRGRLVIQSDSARLTGRVLSAFAAPATGTQPSGAGLRLGLIPVSYDDGSFKARVQVTVAGSVVPAATWDVGASLVSLGAVRQDGSGRIQVTLPNIPVIYEQDMEFAVGDYDLVAVARETQTDTLLSKEVHGTWPNINAELATIGPVAVSQPRAGGFLKNGLKQTQGAVIVAEDEPLRPDVPTAVIALVCRAKDQKRPLRVVRTLVGEDTTPVGTTELAVSAERCAQVVDLIPPKTLGAGRYRFVIAVSSDGKELTRVERALVVPDAASAPLKSAS